MNKTQPKVSDSRNRILSLLVAAALFLLGLVMVNVDSDAVETIGRASFIASAFFWAAAFQVNRPPQRYTRDP